MKNYKRKALLFCVTLTMLFAGMYAILSVASHRAFIEYGLSWKKYSLQGLVNNLVVGLCIAFLPYEHIYAKVARWFCKKENSSNKPQTIGSLILLIVNILLGIITCFIRNRQLNYFESSRFYFEYAMLFFICLCVCIVICSKDINNKVIRCSIRSLSVLYNSFLIFFISKTMGQGIIVAVAMSALIVVYDIVLDKKLNWKEVLVTLAVGIGAISVGLLAKDYHNLEKLNALSRNLFSFNKVDMFLGTGYNLLFVFLAVSTVAVLGFAIKVMSRKNTIRTGFLLGATVLYISAFVYIFLSSFEIIPCAEIQLITNRIHIIVYTIIIRCFIIIPAPRHQEIIKRGHDSDFDSDKKDNMEWVMDQIEDLVNKQTLILNYLIGITIKLEELSLDKNNEKYEALKAEIENEKENLKKNNIPMDKQQFYEQLKDVFEKKKE